MTHPCHKSQVHRLLKARHRSLLPRGCLSPHPHPCSHDNIIEQTLCILWSRKEAEALFAPTSGPGPGPVPAQPRETVLKAGPPGPGHHGAGALWGKGAIGQSPVSLHLSSWFPWTHPIFTKALALDMRPCLYLCMMFRLEIR